MSIIISSETGITAPAITTPTASVNNKKIDNAVIPVGAVMFFLFDDDHDGFLKLNGAAVSRFSYSALYAKIGVKYGAGDGSTTFNLPDFRGGFFRAWDDGRGVDVGRVIGSYQEDAIRNISGQVIDWTCNVSRSEQFATGPFYGTGNVGYQGTVSSIGTGYHDKLYFDASRVVPTASENRPINYALLACIKY